jgi:hypothetical protein
MKAFLTSIVALVAITAVSWLALGQLRMSSQDVYQVKPNVRL